MSERIQKILARAGVASRRQVEEWIKAGRVKVNGAPATLGMPVGPRDSVALDGRTVRIKIADSAVCVVLYHRPPDVNLAQHDDAAAAKLYSKLPKSAGRRWIAVSPLPPHDSGLELLTTDGTLAQALMRKVNDLPMSFSVRVRGEPRLEQLDHIKKGMLAEGEPLRVESVELTGGEASNRWFDITAIGGRARDLRRLFEEAGLQLSRLMRVALGPIKMDRSLASGRTQTLDELATEELYQLAGIEMPAAPVKGKPGQSPVRAGAKPKTLPSKRPATRRPAKKSNSRRKPTGSRKSRR